ncbi:MAG: HIT family protein [Phycisphaerales bacterium]
MSRKNIWAPWRLQYLDRLKDELDETDPKVERGERPFTDDETPTFLTEYWVKPELDAEHFVVLRDEYGFACLNRYPYSNGHLVVALGDPRPRLMDYEAEQRASLWRLVDRATDLVERSLNPQGINIGVNQGRAAGAGVPTHLHVHVVPRWGGDTNFITVVGDIRVVPESLESMYQRYAATVDAEENRGKS